MNIQHAIILVCLAAFSLSGVSAMAGDGSLAVDMHYDNGKVSLNELRLLEREPPDFFHEPEEGFTAKILAFNGSMLYSRKFEFSLWAYDNPQVLAETDELLILPYYNHMEEFRLYDSDGKLMLSADLSEYAICNQNGMCNPDYGETEKTCAEDCREGMPVEEERPAEKAPAEEEGEEKAEEKPRVSADYILIGILGFVLVVIILLSVRAKKRQQ